MLRLLLHQLTLLLYQLMLLLLLLLQDKLPGGRHVVEVLGHVGLSDVAVLERLEDPVGDVLLFVVVGKPLSQLGVLLLLLLLLPQLLLFGLLLLLLCSGSVEPLRHGPLLLHDALQVVEKLSWRSLFYLWSK